MNRNEAEELFDKYMAGNCDVEEKLLFETLYAGIARSEKHDALDGYDLNEVKEKIYSRLPKSQPVKTTKLWLRISTVAAAVAAVSLGVWFYLAQPPIVNDNSQILTQNDIAPGRNTATLTLTNGQTINLSSAKKGVILGATKLTYNDGTIVDPSNASSLPGGIMKQSPGETLTAATPRGGQYQFILPDGTQVWLNAASKISFPTQFLGTIRKVFLSGEAYFEVAKNKDKPFIVESKGQQVTVLGTHFNINAYEDETSTKTTLLEGLVKVSSLSGASSLQEGSSKRGQTGSEQILSPNQQAINNGTTIKVKRIDPEEAIAWKNGLFIFEAESLSSIMKRVSRWYNIQVIYQEPDLGNEVFSGSVSRFDNISSLLKQLENTAPLKFKIEGERVIVSRK